MLLFVAQICTKWFIRCDFAPDPTAGAYSAASDLLAGSGGEAPEERRGRDGEWKEKGEGKV